MTPNFNKNTDGLLPVIIQDATSNQVLMLGYMNEEAFNKTKKEKELLFSPEVNNDFGQKENLQTTF